MSEPSERCTDLGNARRLVRLYGGELRYCRGRRDWLCFRGGRWCVDEIGRVEQFAKSVVMGIYAEAAAAQGDETRKALARWAAASEHVSRIRAMIDLATTEPEVAVPAEALDAHPHLLCLENGTLDLLTLELREHNPLDLLTCQAPVRFEPSATAPRWLAFLDRVFGDNQDLVRFVQKCVGYTLVGTLDEQVFLLLHGTGANGKTVFLRILLALLGPYGRSADFSTFTPRRGEGPRNDIARLAGARLVVAAEAGEGRQFDEELLKRLTGGDRITARLLYQEAVEFSPSFTLWLSANHRPSIRGTDHAIWRRVILVPFDVTIPESEQDPQLVDKLREELPGILRWALDGYSLWRAEGLGRPPAIRTAVAEYRAVSDLLGEFYEQACIFAAGNRTPAAALWSAYQAWAREAGERPVARRDFAERLRERGLVSTKSHGTVVWHGVKLAENGGVGTKGESPSGNSPTRENREELYETASPSLPTPPESQLGDAWEPGLRLLGGQR